MPASSPIEPGALPRRAWLRRATAWAGAASLSAALLGCASGPATTGAPDEVRRALAPTGTLRIAVYTGSPTSLVRAAPPQGCLEFREVLAQRAVGAGMRLSASDIQVTNGCTEALNLALRAVANPGDTIAVESPTYYGLLQILESLGLQALEIPASPHTGLSLEALEVAARQCPGLKAVAVTPNLHNPLGCVMPDAHKRRILQMLTARDIPLISGTVTEGKGLNIGYFAQQELDVLSPDSNPLEHMIRLARDVGPQGREQELRNFLGTFNFTGDMVKQAVGTMSGGEKARLVLAMMVWQRPNLLLLDEPTNHLDLATREALSVALNEFEGTVMLVSHDRALLRAVCDEFWLVGRGGVAPFDGDLDDYQRYLLDEAKRLREAAKEASQPAAAPVVAAPPQAPREAQRKLDAQQRQQLATQLKPLKRELEQTDKRMATLGSEKAALEERMAQPMAPADIADAGRRLKAVTDELATLEERWLELSDQIEAASA